MVLNTKLLITFFSDPVFLILIIGVPLVFLVAFLKMLKAKGEILEALPFNCTKLKFFLTMVFELLIIGYVLIILRLFNIIG